MRVMIAVATLEQYATAGTSQRRAADQRFEESLRVRLRRFKPKPSQPIYGSRPEEWVVGPLDLFPTRC
jgi:hypothetical protein